jgi:hypothetical protein
MKSFKGHLLSEVAWQESLSTMLFDLPRGGIVDLKIPLSPSIFKRLWPKPIRSRVFHVTDFEGVYHLGNLQGRKKSISAFYNMQPTFLEDGIRTHGGYVVELDADVLAAAPDDISSAPDTGGTRWLSWSTIFRTMGEKKYLKKMEDDLNEFLIELIMQYADDPKFMPNVNKFYQEFIQIIFHFLEIFFLSHCPENSTPGKPSRSSRIRRT